MTVDRHAMQRMGIAEAQAVDCGHGDAAGLEPGLPGRQREVIQQRQLEQRPRVGELPLGAHFHNTRGSGLASAYAAVAAGVTRLDASVGGLGGCPFAPGASGNIATEDLVYLLRDSGIGVDVDLSAAIDAARVAQSLVGHELPSALLRAGDRIAG